MREARFKDPSIASAKLGLDCRIHSHHFPISCTFPVCPVFSITFCTTGESAALTGSNAVQTTSPAYDTGAVIAVFRFNHSFHSLSVVFCTSSILFPSHPTRRSAKLGVYVSLPSFLSQSSAVNI